MPTEQALVDAEDAPVAVSRFLGRGDVARVTVKDLDGETVIQVAGTADPSDGAQQVLAALGEPEGGSTQLRVVAETVGVRPGPTGVEGAETLPPVPNESFDDPLRNPDVDEPEPRDGRR